MHGCRICQSASVFEAQTLRCGHQFCKECLLSLLPDSSNFSVSILPQHIAIIVCPRCHEKCEYSRVHEERHRGKAVRTGTAPSPFADEAERRRLRKRAQFIQVYKRETVQWNRKSRSRLLLEEDQFPVQHFRRKDSTSLLASHTFRRTRNKGYQPIGHGGPSCWVPRGIRADDVRAIDHVNGRFVACIIVSDPGRTTDAHAGRRTSPHADAQLPRRVGSTSPYAAATPRLEYHRSPEQGTESCPLRVSAAKFVTATGHSTVSCCSDPNTRQGIAAGMFVLLLIAIIVTTSIISAS
ncbi:uncharacterized protein LOC119721167 [Patiria miniata]|uniref:RING-type domain-containing protein n=1 Tax=Patiria miniata TaxID=46514 RepID=A0A913Z7Y6_PATMI|nr:uncharacterized protein LOC119721167 [Patiria miniata]